MQRKVQGAERFDRKTDADGAGELTDFIFSAGFTDSNLLKYGEYGAIIPLSCIVNDGGQNPSILNNGCVEGYGEANKNWIGLG